MKSALLVMWLFAGSIAYGGRCVGADHCLACKDCSECWYCNPRNPQGGSCGVIRDQSAEAMHKRLQKQSKRDKKA